MRSWPELSWMDAEMKSKNDTCLHVKRPSPCAGRYPPFGLFLVSLAILSGCGPNHRYYSKQNIELSAVFKHGEAIYRNVQIGTQTRPFDQNLDAYGDVFVELVEGDVVPLSALTVAKLEEASSKTKNLDDVGYDTGWPKGSRRITVGTRLFAIVNAGRILQLDANTVGLRTGERAPRFGRKDSDASYAMPFNHQQVLKLFGEPDKLNDVWHK